MNDHYYGMLIAELEAHIEDRERTMRAMSDELANYESIATMYSAALAAQHDKIAWLQAQLAAALATIEQAAWCEQCGLPAEHCRENHASGPEYAEGCKP